MKQIKFYGTSNGCTEVLQEGTHFLVRYSTNDIGYIEEYRYKEDAIIHYQFCKYSLDKLAD